MQIYHREIRFTQSLPRDAGLFICTPMPCPNVEEYKGWTGLSPPATYLDYPWDTFTFKGGKTALAPC